MSSLPDVSSSFLGPKDPQQVVIDHIDSSPPFLIVADHADRLIPGHLGNMGLEANHLDRHIAYDIGALWAAKHLAAITGACLIHTRYSRLVLDVNRGQDDPGQIPAISDQTPIPANQNMTAQMRQQRLKALFDPYHQAIADQLDSIAAQGKTPALISIHSFTPHMNGIARPWDIGFVWEHDARLVLPVIEGLRAKGWRVGDNEPYSGLGHPRGYTNHVHAEKLGRPNLLVEFRQDLIATEKDAITWANHLAEILLPLLADPGLYQRWRGPS